MWLADSRDFIAIQEDAQIIKLVEKYGCKNWSLIAKSITGRIGKQCRERYHKII